MCNPGVFISFRMPFGVALSGPPSEFTATVNFLCSSTVQRRRAGLLSPSVFDKDGPVLERDMLTKSMAAAPVVRMCLPLLIDAQAIILTCPLA